MVTKCVRGWRSQRGKMCYPLGTKKAATALGLEEQSKDWSVPRASSSVPHPAALSRKPEQTVLFRSCSARYGGSWSWQQLAAAASAWPGASTAVGRDSPFLLLPFHVTPGPLFGRTEPRIQLAKAWEMGLLVFSPSITQEESVAE